MNKPLPLGVTGGIGSGKSVVCKILEILGVPVYCADDRAKELMNSDRELRKGIEALFGTESYTESGLNRAHIAAVAFHDKKLLDQLNQLVHPAVAKDLQQWISCQSSTIVAEEAALLFETGSYKKFDQVWLVSCPADIRIDRIAKRDPHRTKKDIQAIIEKQWPDEKKRSLANLEIVNDGKTPILKKLIEEVRKLKHDT